jgi:cytochrome c-type biogenesis protein CcmH/NrfG
MIMGQSFKLGSGSSPTPSTGPGPQKQPTAAPQNQTLRLGLLIAAVVVALGVLAYNIYQFVKPPPTTPSLPDNDATRQEDPPEQPSGDSSRLPTADTLKVVLEAGGRPVATVQRAVL